MEENIKTQFADKLSSHPDSLDSKKIRYAGFRLRMLASAIDSFISVILLWPIAQLFSQIFGKNETQEKLANGLLTINEMPHDQLFNLIYYQLISMAWQNIFLAIAVILCWIYFSATPGKKLLKMKIIDEKTGRHPTNKQLIIRYFGYFASFSCLGLGFIWIYYSKKRQGWHDIMAGTVVIMDD